MSEEAIRCAIQKCVGKQQYNFIIMPMGKWGRVTKEILNMEFGIQERFCVDNELCDMKKIFSIKNMPTPKQNDIFLNVVCDPYTEYFLNQEVYEKYPEAKIICVFREKEIEEVFLSENKVHLDFLCVGFPKCGTTSLDIALRENKKLYLPPIKETQFFWNINKETHEIYKNYYPEKETNGKFVGAIEPAYRTMPNYVFNYYGKDLKVIFCLRNPAYALYSYYKMAMRIFTGSNIQHIRKYENITAQTFDIWAKEKKETFRYSKYIKNFLQYYSKKQIKIIISEEIFAKPEVQMDQLQEFIGLNENERFKYGVFPHINKVDKVSKNYSMALINKELGQIMREIKHSIPSYLTDFCRIRSRIENITMKGYNENMLTSTYDYLMNYYMESIWELEEIVERSLKDIWY